MVDSAPTSSDERLVDPDLDWGPDYQPFRYSLRALLLLTLIAAVILGAGLQFLQWLSSRPGRAVTEEKYWPIEIKEVVDRLGPNAFQRLQVWHLYGGYFGSDYVWQGKATREAVNSLQQVAHMKSVNVSQLPTEFWNMPRSWSEMPGWWKPKPIDNAEYYMSPTFVPRSVINNNLDCVAMYDPNQQMLYVWSQWDF